MSPHTKSSSHQATAWLQGDQEDSAMAYYSFLRPLWAFLGRIDFDHHKINIDAAQFGRGRGRESVGIV